MFYVERAKKALCDFPWTFRVSDFFWDVEELTFLITLWNNSWCTIAMLNLITESIKTFLIVFLLKINFNILAFKIYSRI